MSPSLSSLRLVLLLAVVAISACSARAHCKGERPYQSADSVALAEEIDGVRVPRSSSALIIPDEPAEGPPYAEHYEDEKGRERIRCLDEPPRLDPVIEARS